MLSPCLLHKQTLVSYKMKVHFRFVSRIKLVSSDCQARTYDTTVKGLFLSSKYLCVMLCLILFLLIEPSSSETRFGKISPLRQQKLRLWQFLEGLFGLWQFFEPTLANLNAIGQIFRIINGQILKNDLAIWSHCLSVGLLLTLSLNGCSSNPITLCMVTE